MRRSVWVFRRLIPALAAPVVLVAALSVVPQVAAAQLAGSRSGHVPAALCPTSIYDWNVVAAPPPLQAPYGQADWESNGCNDTMQVKVVCTTLGGAVYTNYSGEVRGLEINDVARCDYGSYIDAFLIDKRDSGSWHQLWP